MAVSPSSPSMVEPKPESEPWKQHRSPEQQPQSQPDPATNSSYSKNPPSNPSLLPSESPAPHLIIPPPPAVQFFNPSLMTPSFRPVNQIQVTSQFSPVPNPSLQNPSMQNPQNLSLQNPPSMPNQSLQPPGVVSAPISMSLVPQQSVTPLAPGAISITVSPIQYQVRGQPNLGAPQFQAPHSFVQMPNGYAPVPAASAHSMPPPGIPRYPTPYTAMVRPTFPPRPPATISGVPPLSRPPVPGIRGVPPMVNPAIRPAVPIIAMTEKPQTTVYVGKISPTVENDFLLSLLRLCGPVKSWKRAQDPTNGSPRGFGFCEFESAEGVLRALRLLSKFNVDGLELVLNVNQATKDYLDRYVQKKVEREKKLKEAGTEDAAKVDEAAPGVENHDPPKPSLEDSKRNTADDSTENLNKDPQKFGIVTEEDRESDRDASEKLMNMMEERLKNKPLPPPPPAQTLTDASGKSNSEVPTKSRDGDSDVDIMKSDAGEDKNDDETTSESKPNIEHERPETSSPDRGRRYDKRSRERDRERDLKREKERELERYERERERERVRRERDRELRTREAERLYKERVKEWESRERDKEYQRQHEKEREKERQRERQKEIMDQEDESDEDDSRKRRRRSSALEEKRKKRQREKEDDLDDRLREEEEITEAKRRAIEDQQRQKDEAKPVSDPVINGNDQTLKPMNGSSVEGRENSMDQAYESDSGLGNLAGEVVLRNGAVIGEGDESGFYPTLDSRQNSNLPARKLGFGLVGSGKRTTVPSVFHEEDDEEVDKEKKMRPLVPIDYSTEEMQAVQATVSGAPPNLVAAAEFAKRIANIKPKEEKPESERERSRRLSDRSSERDREHGLDKAKVLENKKLLDAKQLIDMIPKTKEELFSYDINWTIYDKHGLHERMRPWISKKITEFLGEEEATLVEYIVSSTKDHVQASQMLELLQSILDDEAEMFVLKMWRMLIFEIKKVETGLSLKSRA